MATQKQPTKVFQRLIVLLLLLHTTKEVWAHEDNNVHARLSVASLMFLDQTFPEDGALFPMQHRDMIPWGSVNEDGTNDTDLVFQHHFFNPRTGGAFLPTSLTAPERAAIFWPLAVQNYRSGQYRIGFEQLGHVLHLLQDMTSPAHVHLDPHGPGPYCGGDNDDFEIWGYCEDYGFNAILEYVTSTNVASSQIQSRLSVGLQRIFANQPQVVASGTNTAYSYVSNLAFQVYEFTTFYVVLKDTGSLFSNDEGAGELDSMFDVWEFPGASGGWYFEDSAGWNIWSQGECGGNRSDQAWWLMPDGRCQASSCPDQLNCTIDSGWAYIENVGGGSGGGAAIPDTLIPKYYNRNWFERRYNAPSNGTNTGRITMLRIYGDVLYAAAVAYGAGLLQSFLDNAIMPKPITDSPSQLTPFGAQLNGRVRPAGPAASAWFEWGTNSSYGMTTTNLPVGTGQALTNLNLVIDGLTPDTVYHCRIVSSNQYGIRHGTNLTFRTPTFYLISQIPNAWQITDRSTANGSMLRYLTNLTGPHRTAATNSGFRFLVNGRFLNSFGGNVSMNMSYGLGADRFLIWWNLDQNGNLIANLDGAAMLTLTTNGAGSADYHTHEIVYNPTNRRASYLVDGIVKTNNWVPSTFDWPAGEISWGAGSSSGMGQMNFHAVEFEIAGSIEAASYRAGSSGNPAPSPSPLTQGWTQSPTPPGLSNSSTLIFPDFEAHLPLVETLAASEVRTATARLNGRVDPRGESASGWFEWGPTAAYGTATLPHALGGGFGWTNVSEELTGLAAGQSYHFRLVVSNLHMVVFGANQTFVTAQPIVITARTVPAAGQFWFQFTATPGTQCEVSRSTDLVTWTPIGAGDEATPGLFEFLDTASPATRAFYRVRSTTP